MLCTRPSLMPTNMVLESGWNVMSTVEEGLEAIIRLAIDPALEGITGRYFDGLQEAKANVQAYDREVRSRLAVLTGDLIATALRPIA